MKDNKFIMDKIKKILDTNEQNIFNKAIKDLVKESTEKNIAKVKADLEKKAQKLITESKATMEKDNELLLEEILVEEIAIIENDAKKEQLKLIKENKNLKQKIVTLNKNVSDLTQSLKIKQNQVTSLKNETPEKKDVVNESLMIDGVDISPLITGIHGNESTSLNQVNKNLSNEQPLHNDVVRMLASMKHI